MLFAIYLHLNVSKKMFNDFVSINNLHNCLDYNMVAEKPIESADHYPEIDSCCITQNSRLNDCISTLHNAFLLE